MLSYSEFINKTNHINESIDLILESEVLFSENLIKIFSKIKHPLAKKILDLYKKDIPVTNNFFDLVKDDNSKVSFIQDRKAQQILSDNKKYVNFIGGNSGWLKHSPSNKNIFDILGYKPEGTAFRPNSIQIGEVIGEYKSPKTGKTYQYVKFEDGEGVYNIEKLQKADSSKIPMNVKGRQDINVGKAMRALLMSSKIEFTNKELEDFVNDFKSTVDLYGGKFQNFELVTGEDIRYWYHENNYAEGSSTLHSSCMRYEECQDYLDIYVMNPNVCSLLILKKDDKLIARALVWTLIDGKKFMDRIYYVNDSDVNLYREYAKANGIYAKYYNGSSAYSDVYDFEGNKKNIQLIVQVKSSHYYSYPYMDTLKYYDPYSGKLSIYNDSGSYTLEDTEGGYSHCDMCDGTGTVECSDCSGRGKIDCEDCDGNGKVDCWRCDGDGEKECSSCDGEGTFECDDCDGDGEKDCNYCDGSGKDDDDDDCVYCDGTGKKQCKTCDGKGKYDCEDCDGDGKNDCPYCDGDGEVECSNCDGDGEETCSNCGGDGEVECPQCQ